MAAGLIPAGFTGRPVLVHIARGEARTVTLLGRVDETAPPAAAEDLEAASTLTGPRRREFLGGRALLRRAVAELSGAPAEAVRIGTRDGSRPVCLSTREVDVSISHSAGRIAATAARGCEVGVDIQIPVPVSARLLRRYNVAGTEPATRAGPRPGGRTPTAAPAERGDSPSQVDDSHYEFADAWTVREACAKSLGLRVGADLWRIRVPPGAHHGHWAAAHWYRLPPFQDCPVALAMRPRGRSRRRSTSPSRPAGSPP
ncbi:4'-phosphopantetheinyl transferase family protein [Streptomyces sp. NPDC091287]|uniref:4'-phosphopantetheinyl transferase family protein n=1 Tax=Streptomyces sp. NPDC091287 TaxID=3365988 RepID=UPI00381247DA